METHQTAVKDSDILTELGLIYKEDFSTVYDGNELNATFVLKETNLNVK